MDAPAGDMSLDPKSFKRWVASRKAEVAYAVANGEITLEAACRKYDVSEEELNRWVGLYTAGGPKALRATRIQHYR